MMYSKLATQSKMSMTCTPTLTLSVIFHHLRLNNVIITLQNQLHSPQKQNKTNYPNQLTFYTGEWQ